MRKEVDKVSLDQFDRKRDLECLAVWVHAPHVARWWGNPETQLRAVLEPPAGGDEALIVADGVPVGYVRWQRVPREELEAAGLHEIPDGTIDIDIAIGEADYVGCGIASRALRQLVARLVSDRSIPMIMMATSVENTMAVRAYEKAGFRRLRTFQDPEYGLMWLFVVAKSTA